MSDQLATQPETRITAEVSTELKRLGVEGVSVRFVAERAAVRLSWPHHHDGAVSEEGVEFPATPEWLKQMRPVLRKWAHASERRRGAMLLR